MITKSKKYLMACSLALMLSGNANLSMAGDTTLFDRIGGMPAINAVLDQFFINNFADPRIAPKWATSDLPRLKEYIGDVICEAAGGPCYYAGSSLDVAHAGMNISDDEYTWTAESLAAALDKLNVKDPEHGEMMALVGSLRGMIVGK